MLMGMSMSTLILSMFFGLIGWGYFMYGKKSGNLISLGCGVGLMIFPYFITNTLWMIIIGIVMMIVPFAV